MTATCLATRSGVAGFCFGRRAQRPKAKGGAHSASFDLTEQKLLKLVVRRPCYLKRRHALPWHLAERNIYGHLLTKLWDRVVAREARAVDYQAGVPDDKTWPCRSSWVVCEAYRTWCDGVYMPSPCHRRLSHQSNLNRGLRIDEGVERREPWNYRFRGDRIHK